MMEIAALEPGAPIPCATRLTLSCDTDHGLLPVVETFTHADGFIGAYGAAMARGWKDTSRAGQRVQFGPCCSGKELRK